MAARSMIHCSIPKLGGWAILKSQLCEDLLQTIEAASANEPDRSRGQSEFLCYFGVGHRRLFIEKQLHQLRAARRKTFNRIADGLLFLYLLQHHGSCCDLFRQLLLHGVELNI